MTSSFPKSLDTIYGGCRGVRQGGRRGHRQQIPDPGVCRRRDRAWTAGARRGDQRHRRDVPHRLLLLCRQGSDLCVLRPRCRSGSTAACRTPGCIFGGGMELMNEFYKKANIYAHSLRQHRLPDGRLVPQGDQGRVADSQRAQIPHRRLCRAGCCRSSAACRSRSPAATSMRRWRRATIDAAEWVGPYDDEKLGLARRSRPTTTIPAGGKAAPCCTISSTRQVERAAAGLQVGRAHLLGNGQRLDAVEIRRGNPAALRRLLGAGAKLIAVPDRR